MSHRHLLRVFGIAGGLSVLFVAQLGAARVMRSAESPFIGPPDTSIRRWDPMWVRILSLGNPALVADWQLIRFLTLDPSTSPVAAGTHPQFYYDLDLATDLDPAFFGLYVAGVNALVVIRSDAEGAVLLLEKANRFQKEELSRYPVSFQKEYWGQAWVIPLLRAYVELFERDNLPAAGRAFEEAAADPKAPSYLSSLTRRFKEKDGAFKVGRRLLGFMLERSHSEAQRKEVERKIADLEVQYFMFVLNRDFETFRAVSKKNRNKGAEVFLRMTGRPSRDPRGGVLSIDADGKWVTTTAYRKVMGLP